MTEEFESLESRVEQIALSHSGYRLLYPPAEKVGVITVNNFPDLGKITALRFLEWVQNNPGGVISLPTGKTPQYFIKYVKHYLHTWKEKNTQKELEEYGVDPGNVPRMKSLKFVQIDEFYPISSEQHNSFYYYVNKYYVHDFGLDPKKALLIDCGKIGLQNNVTLKDVWPDNKVDLSLRYRLPDNKQEAIQKQVLESIDQWCYEYEQKIRKMGGIGFFLGGIGPDGHIAFNVAGSDHNSTTRLTKLNYETQAAAASDLGGIEVARTRLAITIGLSTLTYNTDAAVIIMAAGDAKAKMVRDAVYSKPFIRYPATILQSLPQARFYLTQGAASLLSERRLIDLRNEKKISDQQIERIIIDIACRKDKVIRNLNKKDFSKDKFGNTLIQKINEAPEELLKKVDSSLKNKLKAGSNVRDGLKFLHTSPHHDDIMLGFFPAVVRHIRKSNNSHIFAYMTSGFNAVTNKYALDMVKNLRWFINSEEFQELLDIGYFSPVNIQGRNRDVWQYLDGVASNNADNKSNGEARRLLRNVIEIFEDENFENLKHRIDELLHYFETQYAGKKDIPHIQKLKGMIREWEADCLWGYLGFNYKSVKHLRLGFYKGDIFTEEPTFQRDVTPVLKLLHNTQPDVVSIAFDPEGSGPDTHYKILQAMAEALRQYEKDSGRSNIEVWGYRNVWYRFHPSEVNSVIPVSLNMLAIMKNAFLNSFVSQKDASFPSYEYNGPFSGYAQKIQVEQYQMLKTCLGREFFNEHSSPLIRATRGFVFLKKMKLQEFYNYARELRNITERIGGEQ
ncbi:MAG: glucosamine-6-phosphate deaminase [bacterium]